METKTLVSMRTTVPLGELVSERWDPEYWDPKYEPVYEALRKHPVVCPLEDFITFITYGQVGKRIFSNRGSVRYLQVINIRDTGIDFLIKPDRLKEGSYNDLSRSRVKVDDILFTNNSFGGMTRLLGRCVVVSRDYGKVNISQDIDIIRVSGINPYYVCVFIKSEFGQQQVSRLKYGVRSTKLSFKQVKQILSPKIDDKVQAEIERQYRLMASYHDQAMERKEEIASRTGKHGKDLEEIAKSDTKYSKFIGIAGEILKYLIG